MTTPHIFVVSADAGPPSNLTDGDCVDGDPTWAPDGSAIALLQRAMRTATTITLRVAHPSRWRPTAVPDGYRRSG